jgi:hypothetical protein
VGLIPRPRSPTLNDDDDDDDDDDDTINSMEQTPS